MRTLIAALIITLVATAAPAAGQTSQPPKAPTPAPPPKLVGPPAPGLEEAARLMAELAAQQSLESIDVAAVKAEARAMSQAVLADVEATRLFGDLERHTLEAILAQAQTGSAEAKKALSEAEKSYQEATRQIQRERERLVYEGRLHLELGEQESYEAGTMMLDRGNYERAVQLFDGIIAKGSPKAEGAHYWKAYAQSRLGQQAEALATLEALLKKYPNGRWVNDAKALQVEVKQASGHPVKPEQMTSEELKLIAINALLHSDAAEATVMLESLLQGTSSPKLKERALFVLAQSSSAKAREAIVAVAKGKGNPDLQMKAIEYLGLSRDPATGKLLMEIYRTTSDIDVKKRIIRSFATTYGAPFVRMVSPDRVFVGTAGGVAGGASGVYVAPNVGVKAVDEARTKAVAEMSDAEKQRAARTEEARATLRQLYQSESSVELKKEILRNMFMTDTADWLLEVARTEKDTELRAMAVQSLGMVRGAKSGEALLSLYRDEKDVAVRRKILFALSAQQNATALVQIARQETDPELKKAAVERLASMKNKEATDYMMELLKK